MKPLLPLAALLILPTLASAQNANVDERRGFVTLGVYLPTDSGLEIGGAFSVGGNFITRERFRLGAELRSSSSAVEGFSESALTVGSIFLTASSRPENGRGFFFGGGLGFARASVSDGNVTFTDDDSEFAYAAFVGFDLSRTTFAQARYQGAANDGYAGFSVEFGYRF